MNVDQAKALCRDFNPTRTNEGRVQCKSLIQGEFCTLGTHFRCELIVYRDREKVEGRRYLPMLSHSRIDSFERCPREYALKYIFKAESPSDKNWMIVGSSFSNARAKIDSGQPWTVSDSPDPFSAAKVKAILRHYENEPRPAVDNEIEVRTTIRSEKREYILRGYVDAISKDRTVITEWKYAVSEYDILKITPQASVYFACVPEAKELILARARKPKHEPKDGETPAEFEQRVFDSFVRKEGAKSFTPPFERKTYLRSDFNIDFEIDRLVNLYEVAESFRKINFPPNYRSCDQCDFKPYCIEHVAKGIGCSDEKCSHPSICGRVKERI